MLTLEYEGCPVRLFEDPDYEWFSWTGRYEDDPSFVPKGATARYRVVILHR